MQTFKDGNYWMSAPKAGLATNDNGKDYFFIEGQITHRETGQGEWEPVAEPQTRTLFMWLTTDKAQEISFAQLKSLGWNKSFDNPAFKFTGTDNDGLRVKCSLETYEGKTRDKWSLPGGGMEHKEADTAKKKMLLAKYAALTGDAPVAVAAGGPPSREPGDEPEVF